MVRAAAVAVAAALAGAPAAARARCPAEAPALAPPCGLTALERQRDAFVQRAAAAGHPLPAPALREVTGPRLLAWNAATGEVEVPRWEELPEAERALLARMAGSPARAPELFAWLYRWFYLPRALAEALLARGGAGPADARRADDLAVAFLAGQPLGAERLARAAGLVEEALARLSAELGDPAAAGRRTELERARAALARRGRGFEELLAGAR